ncbi:transposase domain-containing protein [Ectothiorhodospira shaposhnikovii]|uniref:transposase domain-containing protein n=1 Tax=Ectothiorhodospira shaposhnikovii TaxID=1054 RepID=UPI0023E847A2|nr:transposase domain-containing protein [Ectothiorhodospira shaposhnikovii]
METCKQNGFFPHDCRHPAILLTLLETCKQNGVNPRHYLIDVLERIQDHPANRLQELLPYHWAPLAQSCGEHASPE